MNTTLNNIFKGSMAVVAAAMLLSSCDYLNVAPEKRQTLNDALKTKEDADGWVQSCYSAVGETNPTQYTKYESSTDEFVHPMLWGEMGQKVSWNNIYPGWDGNGWWYNLYGYIGHAHLFLEQLRTAPTPVGMTDANRVRYEAEIKFTKAYNHFRLMNLYGPIPIMDEMLSRSTPSSQFPGRSHYDYCTEYVCRLLDEAAKDLPYTYSLDAFYGRANATICAALKARALLYDASPLWNGSFPYPNWVNENYETPGYGKALVSTTYDKAKWQKALQANLEALDIATKKGGRKLMDLQTANGIATNQKVPLPYVPGVTEEYEQNEANAGTDRYDEERAKELRTFLERVRMLRYICNSDETQGNTEFIFGTSSQDNTASELPYRMYKRSDGQWWNGYNGCNPTLYTVEHFYTKNGKLPANDPKFVSEDNWLLSANAQGYNVSRADIINLNVNREPRFYAMISFDGDDYGSLIREGKPLRIQLRNSDEQGYDPSFAARDLNQTGYFTRKYVAPNLQFMGNTNNIDNRYYPRPIIRLAELYLNIAECYCELGDTENSLKYLNVIRERAGIPALTAADCGKDMTLREWIHNERFIEFYFEGQRYYDLRRWCEAPQRLGKTVYGLGAFGKRNPTFEEFNRRVKIDQPFQWDNRLYLMPIPPKELYSNPQLVQAPGY